MRADERFPSQYYRPPFFSRLICFLSIRVGSLGIELLVFISCGSITFLPFVCSFFLLLLSWMRICLMSFSSVVVSLCRLVCPCCFFLFLVDGHGDEVLFLTV